MQSITSLNRILLSAGLLAFTLLLGTLGFKLIESYSWLDAIYMTVITMSTVGFGTVTELSTLGKVFSVFLIIISASTFVYAVTTITTFVVEGEVRHLFYRYRIYKKVTKLKDHIVICGLGRNGREAALELIRQKSEFVVIESNERVVSEFQDQYDVQILAVIGDATHDDILERANLKQAKGLVSSLSSDAENVYITLSARGINSDLYIVARASNEGTISKLKRAGANEVIVPNLIGGRRMVNMIVRPALMEFIDLVTGEGNPDLHLEDIACSTHPQLIGKTLSDLHIRSRTGVVVIGFKRNDQNIELNPPAHQPLRQADRLFVLGNSKQLDKFREMYLR